MKYPKMQEAAKKRVAARTRDTNGKFSKATQPVLPPKSNLEYSSVFNTIPNPVAKVYFNPDTAFQDNPANANRMIQDQGIFAPLQERQLATAGQSWNITPMNENNPEEKAAADHIENIIRFRLPNLLDYFRNLLDAIYFGRSACTMDYKWDFSQGRRQLIPAGWTPIHGDTLVFADDGKIGYRVGVPPRNASVTATVEGLAIMVDNDPDVIDGYKYLSGSDREAWVVHHGQKCAGEFNMFQSAASRWGVGLRSRLYPSWVMKQSVLEFAMMNAEKFGAGWVIGYFNGGNPDSVTAMKEALQKQVGSSTLLIPRWEASDQSIEGIETLDPPSGSEALMKLVEYYDKQMRQAICGENLTADNKGGGGLGSGVAQAHETTFFRLCKYDAGALEETLTDQLVSVLQKYNGYDHLPPMRFSFAYDTGSIDEKLARAKILHEMGIKLSTSELIVAAGFSVPKEEEIITNSEKKDVSEAETDKESLGAEEKTENFEDNAD